jgi:hypothetical protein
MATQPPPDEGGVLRATLLGHQVRLFKAAVTFLSKLGETLLKRGGRHSARARVRDCSHPPRPPSPPPFHHPRA